MGSRRLRALFQKLATSGGLLAGSGRLMYGCCPPAPTPTASEHVIDPRSMMWKSLVAACRADDDACVSICSLLVFGPTPPENGAITACVLRDRTASEMSVHAEHVLFEECIAGRRPPGLVAAAAPVGSPVAVWLAEVARLEAASVPAFVLVARDLVALGAPPALVAAAVRAADDEVRHARVMTALARAHGAEPAAAVVVPAAPRDAYALALDNAIEGCVREAFAALCATHQAAAVRDPVLRDAFAMIARDETDHAALAFAIDGWLATRLDGAARARVAAARGAAFAELAAATPLDGALADAIGWPDERALLHRARGVLLG